MDLRGVKLALLAPITWPCPPSGYGPWEQIAANIAAGMTRRGLDVTLFATGNSTAAGRISSVVEVGLNEDPAQNADVAIALHVAALFERAHEFDLIHNNLDWKPLTYALASSLPPMLTTIHGFSAPPILAAYYAAAQRSFFCSISDADRDPGLSYLATCYNGIDPESFTFTEKAGEYLAFLGRFHPEKGPHLAIEIAKRAGVRLKLAGVPHDEAYFKELLEPHIDGDAVQLVGHIAGPARDEFLGNALALVHMTTRPERFGLVLVEAMACGTPVLGARMGSLPEIVPDGVTGYLCRDVAEAVARVPQLAALDRSACRARVEAEFSTGRMVDRYCAIYADALRLKRPPPPDEALLRARAHDWWDRPQAFTDEPPRPLYPLHLPTERR
jgi:glycosyltransferase involved in cell wall biosynthesis